MCDKANCEYAVIHDDNKQYIYIQKFIRIEILSTLRF